MYITSPDSAASEKLLRASLVTTERLMPVRRLQRCNQVSAAVIANEAKTERTPRPDVPRPDGMCHQVPSWGEVTIAPRPSASAASRCSRPTNSTRSGIWLGRPTRT